MNLSLLTPAAVLALLAWPAIAADIHVFTDRSHPMRAVPQSVAVVELDAGERLEGELAADLPADPQQAARLVQRRLDQGGAALQRQFATAYQGVTEAWTLRVAKIPAVVVDHRYVVYGESDVGRALLSIARYKKEHP